MVTVGIGLPSKMIANVHSLFLLPSTLAGIECAKLLDKSNDFFVVLIDRKSYFLHNVATLRATVEPEFAEKIMVPYDRLLAHGSFLLFSKDYIDVCSMP